MQITTQSIRVGAVAVVSILASASLSAQTIAQWTFEVTVPTTTGPHAAEVGTGFATTNSLGTVSNPVGNGSSESFSANGWDNPGGFYQFTASTAGFQNVVFSFDSTASNTGPANIGVQYSVDGTNFTQFANFAQMNDSWSSSLYKPESTRSYDFSSITALNNNANAAFRLVVLDSVATNGGTVAPTGTWRVDNVTISAVPEPSTYAALLGLLAIGYVVVRRRR